MHQFFFILLLVCLFNESIKSVAKVEKTAFVVDLIYRDSPLSPFYHSSSSNPSKLIRKAALRSLKRLNFSRSSTHTYDDEKDIHSELRRDSYNYLMRIYIGSPPVEFIGIADLGSDFIWIQCYPCDDCYHQDAPLFHSRDSPTYQKLSYTDEFCQALEEKEQTPLDHCEYRYEDPQGSYTKGILSSDKLHLEFTSSRLKSFDKLVFGCGHNNRGNYKSNVQGVIGLGRGLFSLINQLHAKMKIDYRFSYCLQPIESTTHSKLKFGSAAKILGADFVSTPLVVEAEHPLGNYYLTLESVSFGYREIWTVQNEKDMKIDFGSSITLLHSSLYNSLEEAVKEVIRETPEEDSTDVFNLCYKEESVANKHLPELKFHFTRGVLELKKTNTFLKYENLFCMAIVATDGVSILGNIAQTNFQVEFDLNKNQVSFAQMNCDNF